MKHFSLMGSLAKTSFLVYASRRTMRACERCEKSYKGGGTRKLLRGHYNPTAYSKKRANLQLAQYEGKRALLCTRCIRTLTKAK